MTNLKDEILQYTWLAREEGFTALEHEIIYRDLCTACGACEAVCPESVIKIDEFPRLIGECTNCGYCLIQCPRSFLPRNEVEEKLFGSSGELLGNSRDIVAVSTKENGQDGGFVTALLNYLIEKKLIDGAIVGGVENRAWKPIGVLADNKKKIKSSAGSRYSASPNLAALKEAKERGLKELAVVGLPCQIEGIRKIEEYPINEVDLAGRIKYTIAIYCSKNYLYSMLQDLVVRKYGLKLEKVTKFDIKGKNFLVYAGNKCTEIPLTELKGYVRKACHVCPDFTGKLADFAIGAVGSPKGWSTVMTRSDKAQKIVKKMLKETNIESKKVTDEKFGLEIIRKLATRKEESARKKTKKRIIQELPLPFKSMEF